MYTISKHYIGEQETVIASSKTLAAAKRRAAKEVFGGHMVITIRAPSGDIVATGTRYRLPGYRNAMENNFSRTAWVDAAGAA